MTYNGPIFDCDTHFYETPDAFRYIPEAMRREWGVEYRGDTDDNFTLYVGDRPVEHLTGYYRPDGTVPAPGKLHEWLRAMKEGRHDPGLRMAPTRDMLHPDARLAKLDEWNVEGCIGYTGNFIATLAYFSDPKALHDVIHSYNRWILDEWGFSYKDRIFTTPIITLDIPERGYEEAEWAIKNGARAILMPMGPFHQKSPADPAYDRLWSMLNEAHVNLTYHVGEATWFHGHMREWGEVPLAPRLQQTAWTWMNAYSERPIVETMSSLIFYNFFKRFPNIKVMSAENGSEWVPAMLTKMDKCRGIAKNGYWPCGQLPDRPSRIFKEHCYVVAYPEDDIKGIIEQTGSAQFLVMGSDYPHSEGVETPGHFFTEALTDVSEADAKAIMYENGRRFLPVAA
ncbi:MAG TPA: amidohydrolase family protein [Sphingobium sp.]|nr:amidohydrolase family protein [Sphingobium sp.]